MGKSALLLTIAGIFAWTVANSNRSNVLIHSADEQAAYQERVLARERALNGFNIVVSGTIGDFDAFRANYTSQPYRDGSFSYETLSVSDDMITVKATGVVGRSEYAIVGDIVRSGSARLAALNFDGPVSSATGRGTSYTITGVDTTPPGWDAGSDPELLASFGNANADGVYSVLESAHEVVTDGLRSELVTGGDDGGWGSFSYGGEINTLSTGGGMADFSALSDLIVGLCDDDGPKYANCRTFSGDHTFAGNTVFGSPTEPVVMIVEGSATLRGSIHGYGVLYVEGDFRTEVGQPIWEGLVYATSPDGNHELRGQPEIYGATILRATDAAGKPYDASLDGQIVDPMTFLVRGEPSFFYSSSALATLTNISTEFGDMLNAGASEPTLIAVRQASNDNEAYETLQ